VPARLAAGNNGGVVERGENDRIIGASRAEVAERPGNGRILGGSRALAGGRRQDADVPELSRRLLAAGLAAGAVSAALLALVLYADRTRLWSMIDLRVYQWGGRLALTDPNVYHLKYHGFLYFTNTPMALTICAAASKVPLAIAKWLMTIVTVASVGLSVWLALGIAGYRRSAGRLGLALLLGALALWLEPVQQTLSFGQVNAVLMVVVLGDLALRDGSRVKGIGMGLAAGFKLVPGIFIAYLLVTRQLRAAAVAAGTFAATILYGFAVLPTESRQYWIDGLFGKFSRFGYTDYVANQSLFALITRTMRSTGPDARQLWLAAAVLVALSGLAIAAWAYHQGRRLLAVAATAITGLLVSPVSWSHHWVWITVVGVALVDLLIRSRSAAALVACMATVLIFLAYPISGGQVVPQGLIWSVPRNHHLEWTWTGLQRLTGNLYVFAGLAFLVGLACYLAVTARATAAAAQPPAPSTPAPSQPAP
jgi:alpha-1,2-mannosyltransferase